MSDSILTRDEVDRPQTFRTDDGWLRYNLAVNLTQM